jgi:hypothetical protein
LFRCGFRHKERSLKRLVLGTEAFGGFLRLGAVMIPGGGVRLFLGGFSVGGFGAFGLRHWQFRVVLWVTEQFWRLSGVGFSAATLPWGGFGLLFLFGLFSSNGGVWLQHFRVMDFEPAQGGGVAGEGSGSELCRGDGQLSVRQSLVSGLDTGVVAVTMSEGNAPWRQYRFVRFGRINLSTVTGFRISDFTLRCSTGFPKRCRTSRQETRFW